MFAQELISLQFHLITKHINRTALVIWNLFYMLFIQSGIKSGQNNSTFELKSTKNNSINIEHLSTAFISSLKLKKIKCASKEGS